METRTDPPAPPRTMAQQSFENHARFVFGYHRVGVPLVALATLYFLVRAGLDFSLDALILALFGVGTTLCVLYARLFANANQDRIIRLEERLRLSRILPDDLRAQLDEITPDQLVALRFASDEEVPELVRRILVGEFTGRKEIKRAIKRWRPDHMRV